MIALNHTDQPNPTLYPDSTYAVSVDVWASKIRTPSTFAEAEDCIIDRIVHYKASCDLEHEYLVVHARHSSGRLVVLGVDRNAQEHVDSSGMSSHNFDIEVNIADGDSRAGLDEQGTQEVMDIMRRERVT